MPASTVLPLPRPIRARRAVVLLGRVVGVLVVAAVVSGCATGQDETLPSTGESAAPSFDEERSAGETSANRPEETSTNADGNAAAAPAAGTGTVADTTALALLATIPVKGRAAKTGYDRAGMFGTAWLDVDRNGCDTRNDILARDLTAIVKAGGCRVMSGTLVSPYTGATIAFVRGNDTSALVQIDHVIALSNAWQTGAQQLTQAERISLANDPINLMAVDGRSNSQKGDGDTATWLPANKAIRCGYVARQVSVKATYGLWVVPAERDAMVRILGGCAGEPAVTSTTFVRGADAADGAPAPAPAPAPDPAPVTVYYANCDAVRAAGAAPIHSGTPGYSSKLDRDQDGIGCDA